MFTRVTRARLGARRGEDQSFNQIAEDMRSLRLEVISIASIVEGTLGVLLSTSSGLISLGALKGYQMSHRAGHIMDHDKEGWHCKSCNARGGCTRGPCKGHGTRREGLVMGLPNISVREGKRERRVVTKGPAMAEDQMGL